MSEMYQPSVARTQISEQAIDVKKILSTDELSAIENCVDSGYSAIPVPHAVLDLAYWHTLTVAEDWVRMVLIRSVEMSAVELELLVHKLKFALRHALDHITAQCRIRDSFPIPKKTIPNSYLLAHDLLVASEEYAAMTAIFTPVRSNDAHLESTNRGLELVYNTPVAYRYAALEVLGHGEDAESDITSLIFEILNKNTVFPEIQAIFEGTQTIKNRQVSYVYSPHHLDQLVNYIPQRRVILPDGLQFPWGSAFETLVLINSFLVRCAYHLLSIYFATQKYPFRGGFESSLVLSIKRDELLNDLSYLADFPQEKIRAFIDYLTYGNRTNTPDPALQPIVPTKSGTLLIPCSHVISNNMQRNLLALIARVEPGLFNSQSALFESAMCDELRSLLEAFPNKAFNRIFSANGKREEIDLVIVDEQTKFLCIFELRWMIQPGDPREISHRLKVCKEKVGQIERKLNFVKMNLKYILSTYFPAVSYTDGAQWKVHGIVVLEGFGGRESQNPEIPVLTLGVLRAGLGKIRGIKELFDWACSLRWLPREDNHFSISKDQARFSSVSISRPGISLNTQARQYFEHLQATVLNEST